MTALLARPSSSFAAGPGLLLPFVGAAGLVGALAVVEPKYAAALVVAAGVLLLVASDVAALPILLVIAMFVEDVAIEPSLGVGRLVGGLALVVIVLYVAVRRIAFPSSSLLWVSGAYGIWILASGLWATSGSMAATVFVSYVLSATYMLAIVLLVRTRRQLRRLFLVLTVGSGFFGVIAFAVYAVSSSGRSSGLEGDPNVFALYQVVAFAPALVLAAGARSLRRRLVLFGVVAVIVLSVVSSLSRGGLLALGIVVAATLLLPVRIFFRRHAQRATYVGALVVAGFAAALVGSSRFVARAQTIFSATDSGSGRTDLWAAALHGWRDHPWLGLGAGNFQTHALDLLQTTPGVCTRCSYVAAGRPVHNSYLEALAELGPLGLALWLGILALTAATLVRAFRRARRGGDLELQRYALALFVSLLGFAVAAVFLSSELSRAIWVLVGLAIVLLEMTRRLPETVPATTVVAASANGKAIVDGASRPHEDELDRRLGQLLRDQERIDHRREALDERERTLAERERRSQTPAPVPPGGDGGEPGPPERDDDTEASSRERELAERLELLREREQLFETRANEREAELGQRTVDLLAERAELERRWAELDELAARGQIAVEQPPSEEARQLRRTQEREAQLAERGVELRAAEDELERGRVELAESAHAVEVGKAELMRRRAELAESARAVEAQQAELERRRAELAESAHAAEARAGELERGRAELAESARAVEARAGELERGRAELAESARTAEERTAELEHRELRLSAGLEATLRCAEDLIEAQDKVLAVSAAEVIKHAGRLREREAELGQRYEELQIMGRSLAEREARTAARERELESRADVLRMREEALDRELAEPATAPLDDEPPPPVSREPEAPASPAPAPVRLHVVDGGGDVLEPRPRHWNLLALEAAAHRCAEEFPEKVEVWETYLLFLREHADASGVLPAGFDAVVGDVFADLVAHERGRR